MTQYLFGLGHVPGVIAGGDDVYPGAEEQADELFSHPEAVLGVGASHDGVFGVLPPPSLRNAPRAALAASQLSSGSPRADYAPDKDNLRSRACCRLEWKPYRNGNPRVDMLCLQSAFSPLPRRS